MSIDDKVQDIEWHDAAEHTEVDLDEIKEKSVLDYLVVRTTYGKIIKKDEYGVLILQDIDQYNRCEIVAVPKGMIPNYDALEVGDDYKTYDNEGYDDKRM